MLKDIVLILPPNNFTDMINPEKPTNSGFYVHYPHLGLCYLAAMCEKENFSVAIIDAVAENLSLLKIMQKLKMISPKVIGITVTAPTLNIIYQLTQEIKKQLPNTTVVLGGPHISADPEILNIFPINFALRGEADYSFAKLCKFLINNEGSLHNIEGLVYKEDGRLQIFGDLVIISDLSALPLPARHLLNNKLYSNPVCYKTTTSVTTVRGCPYDCSFCSRAVRGNIYNENSVEAIIKELKEIKEKHKLQYVTFMDETFTYNKKRTTTLCEEIINAKLNLVWAAQTRADLVNEDLLEIMKKAGCVNLSFGVEASDENIRENIGKPKNILHYKNLVKMCRDIGIETNAYYMFGHYGETQEDFKNTIELALELDTDYASFNLTNIFPGSPIYKKLLAEKKIKREIWDDFALGKGELPLLIPENLNKEILQKTIATAFKKFYFRKKFFIRKIKSLKGMADILHHLKILKVLLGEYVVKYGR